MTGYVLFCRTSAAQRIDTHTQLEILVFSRFLCDCVWQGGNSKLHANKSLYARLDSCGSDVAIEGNDADGGAIDHS